METKFTGGRRVLAPETRKGGTESRDRPAHVGPDRPDRDHMFETRLEGRQPGRPLDGQPGQVGVSRGKGKHQAAAAVKPRVSSADTLTIPAA